MNSLMAPTLFLMALVLLAPANAPAAGDLTPRQREIWGKTKTRLEQV